MSPTYRTGLTMAITAALGLSLAPAASATTSSESAPTKGARTSAKVYDRSALHTTIKAARAGGAQGLMIEIASPIGRYRNAAGYADIAPKTPAKTTGRYHIASVTKSMVATLVMKEIQQGNWTLKTRIKDVYPNLYPGGSDATVGDLLSHRSGMPNHTEQMTGDSFWEKRWWDTRLITIAREKPFYFKAGAKARYSNTGYVTLGKMLEKENGGKSLAGLLEWRIFKPAGMSSSRLSLSTQFARDPFHEIAAETKTNLLKLKVNPSIFSGSGGVESTTQDVNRFYKALFTGKLVAKAQVTDMITARTNSGDLQGYGLGIYSVDTPCGVMYGHDGASFGTRNFAFSSADGRTQVNIAWNGRRWDTEAEPPINDILIEAVRQTCTPKTGRSQSPQVPVAPQPTIDLQHSPVKASDLG